MSETGKSSGVTSLSAIADKIQTQLDQAVALHQRGDLIAAKALYQAILALQPSHPDALHLLGVIALQSEDHPRAIDLIEKAIAISPNNAIFYSNQGVALAAVKQLAAALASYDRAIALDPNYAEAHCSRGSVLYELNQLEAAIASYDKAIILKPDYADAYCNRGCAFYGLKQLESAIMNYNQAIAIDCNHANAYYNLGTALYELKQIETAIANYDRAISIKPDYAGPLYNKSIPLLLQGDFANGWKLYEWRWQDPVNRLLPRQFPQPLWLGEQSLEGKRILLYSEQGLGDTLQFCRYAKLVSALGAHVILEVPNVLIRLLSTLEGVDQLIEWGEKLPDFDYYCPLLSLPLAFNTTLKNIPSSPAYLNVDPQKKTLWGKRLGVKTKPRIGLVWQGSKVHKKNLNRSLNLAALLPYLPDGIEYVCLQKTLDDTDRHVLVANQHILFFGNELNDFTDTAALCDLMDLVISIDTSVAHLAGALGKETWILVLFVPDWRWLLDREDSPWYPTVRLYRQPALYDWQSVLQKLHVDLLAKMNLTPSVHPAK